MEQISTTFDYPKANSNGYHTVGFRGYFVVLVAEHAGLRCDRQSHTLK
jgi:hypothetical protein